MLVFITSLRHPTTATNYDKVLSLLRASLTSVLNQRGTQAFHAIVVANTPAPVIEGKVEWVTVDHAPPPPPLDNLAVRLDKGLKLAAGLVAARKYSPDHVMVFDADDFVSNRLAAFVEGSACGWYVESGYVMREGVPLARKRHSFHTTCGTSLIHKYALMPEPSVASSAPREALLDAFGESYVTEMLGSHRFAVERYAEQGTPLRPLPFPGATYLIGTGENHSQKSTFRPNRVLTRAVRNEFSIPENGTPASAARYVLERALVKPGAWLEKMGALPTDRRGRIRP